MTTNTITHDSDRYFTALANESLGRMDVDGARRIAAQLRAQRGEVPVLRAVARRLGFRHTA